MKHTLILFSGQNDSIQSVVNFLNEEKEALIDLLYIQNVGFRNYSGIPTDAVSRLAEATGRIKSFYVLDGSKYMQAVIQEYAERLTQRAVTIFDCCMVCQYTLHSLYIYVANKLDCNIMLPKKDLFPANLMKIIMFPYKVCRNDVIIYDINATNMKADIKKTELVGRCQLAYFHNYNFEKMPVEIDVEWFQNYYEKISCPKEIKEIVFDTRKE